MGAVLLGAVLVLAPGCGKGIFDRFIADTPDASAAEDPDASPGNADVGPDVEPIFGPDVGVGLGTDADPNGTTTTEQTFDDTGGSLDFAEAHLIIGSGTFSQGTTVEVTLSRIPTISHAGAVGPVFELSVPRSGLFRQDAMLTLDISPSVASAAGANLPDLVLGTLDPNASAAKQSWVQVSGSTFDPNTPSVSGAVTGFGSVASLQFAAVIKCPPITTNCPSGQNCSAGGVCNRCPTGTVCP